MDIGGDGWKAGRCSFEALHAKGLRDRVKVMTGGAPVRRIFADEIGADGLAADAGGASKLGKSLMKRRAVQNSAGEMSR